MKYFTHILMLTAVSLLIAGGSALAAEQVTCKGKVIDPDGNPVEGATISFYTISAGAFDAIELNEEKIVKTASDGAFEFSAPSTTSQFKVGMILASKEGFSIGWLQWRFQKDLAKDIALVEPAAFAGTVVDNTGEPVADAEVGILILEIPGSSDNSFFVNYGYVEGLKTITNSDGRFSFDNLPADAATELLLRKNGYATTVTFESSRGMDFQYKIGQQDVEVRLPEQSLIKGSVVDEDGTPVEGVQVAAVNNANPFTASADKRILTDAEGVFVINSLSAGDCKVMLVNNDVWVSEHVNISLAEAETVEDLKLTVQQGGLLQVKLTDAQTGEPLAGASVNLQATDDSNKGFGLRTDEKGVGKKQLAPGEYQINHLYISGIGQQQPNETVTIEKGKTTEWQFKFEGPPTITGTVRNADGSPVEGVAVMIKPGGNGQDTSDQNGKFSVRFQSNDHWNGEHNLLATDPDKNLAALKQVNRKTQQIDLELTEGLIAKGSVTDVNGNQLENARIIPWIKYDRGTASMHDLAMEFESGNFTWEGIPADGMFQIDVSSDGYGKKRVIIDKNVAVDGVINMEPIALAVADKSISGIVRDPDGETVANARVRASGEGQPENLHVATDEQGKFTIEGLCEGGVRLHVNFNSPGKYMYGDRQAQAGDLDVELLISPSGSRGAIFSQNKAANLTGKKLGDLGTFGIELPAEQSTGRTLVFFFDMMQRPSRHMAGLLAKRAADLKAKGVQIVLVQSSKVERSQLNDWLSKQKIGLASGMVNGDDPDKTLKKWGVESLPWLILTDQQSTVVAEGFRLTELDEKLNKAKLVSSD